MNISNFLLNWYKKLKQILEDSNIALTNRGLNGVNNLYQISTELGRIGYVNRLPYVIGREIIAVTEDDLDGVTAIGNYAFFNCTTLTSVTIPDSVTTIGDSAFRGCDSLKNIYLNPATPPSLYSRKDILDTTTIHVPVGCGDAYKSATNWSLHADRIVEDIVI